MRLVLLLALLSSCRTTGNVAGGNAARSVHDVNCGGGVEVTYYTADGSMAITGRADCAEGNRQ
jgi:hypothetical protein